MRRGSRARIVLRLAHGLDEYLVGRLDASEGRGASVPPAAKALDGGGEGALAVEAAAPEAWCDRIPTTSYLVRPGRRGRREVEREAGMPRKPGDDIGRLVGGRVVEDDVDLARGIGPRSGAGRRGSRRRCGPPACRGRPCRGDVECREQAHRPVALGPQSRHRWKSAGRWRLFSEDRMGR